MGSWIILRPNSFRRLSSIGTNAGAFGNLVENLVNEKTAQLPNYSEELKATPRFPHRGDFSRLTNLPKINLGDAIEILRFAQSYNLEDRIALVDKIAKKIEIQSIEILNHNVEDLSTAMAILIETKKENTPLAHALMHRIKELIGKKAFEINIDLLIRLVSAAKKAQYNFDPIVQETLYSELSKRIGTTTSPNQLLGILKSSLPSTKDSIKLITNSAKKLLPVMNLEELVSLIEQFASRGNRDKECIDQAINRIATSSQILTVNQGETLLTSICRLNIFDARIIRKTVNDLNEKNLNDWKDWNQVTSLANSLTRLRIPNSNLWSMLSQWSLEQFNSKCLDKICLFVSGMAHLGINDQHGREVATRLAKVLNKEKAKSENNWLSSMTSLAYFGVLPVNLAETILNKDFVAQLCNSLRQTPETIMYNLLRLMRINCYAKNCIQDYYGPTLNLHKEFERNFDMTQIARKLKYGTHSKEEGDFLDTFYKVVPLSHCKAPYLHENGTYIEAEIKPTHSGSTRCIAVNEWAYNDVDRNTRPILYYPWNQIHYTYDLSTDCTQDDKDENGSRELHLLGFHQMGIQLLRMEGYNPIVVLDHELRQHAEITETISYLKQRISL